GPVTRCRVPNPTGGTGARKAALCYASSAFPLAEPIPETNPSAIRSTASEVASAPGYRHRVTFAVLPLHKRGIDLPATRPQDLLDPFHGAKHHPVLHAHDTPTTIRLHDLRIQQLE